MTESMTAEIIQFPRPSGAAQHAVPSPVAEATARLAKALAEQHQALVAWRDAMEDLRDSLYQLGGNLRALDTTRHGFTS